MRTIKRAAAAITAAIMAAVFISSCGSRGDIIVEEKTLLMGAPVSIKAHLTDASGRSRARQVIQRAFAEIKKLDDLFSVYNPDSEISRINKLRKKERLLISPEAFHLINNSLVFSELTEGAFDITAKPLVDLWNEAGKDKKLPSQEEIARARSRVGYKNVMLDEKRFTIHFNKAGMEIDLGGVAQGYAADRAIAVLVSEGIDNAIVDISGDIYCLGSKMYNEPWKVGVRNPRSRAKTFLELKLKDKAVSTSGDYEKYFIIDGKRYSHIIDPRTGYPVDNSVVSSTAIAGNAATADIMATAIMVLGSKGLEAAASLGMDAVVVFERENGLIMETTPGIKKRYDISTTSF